MGRSRRQSHRFAAGPVRLRGEPPDFLPLPRSADAGHGFSGSGVASQSVTVPPAVATSQWPSGLNARLLIAPTL